VKTVCISGSCSCSIAWMRCCSKRFTMRASISAVVEGVVVVLGVGVVVVVVASSGAEEAAGGTARYAVDDDMACEWWGDEDKRMSGGQDLKSGSKTDR
jgi:hypothetical protein